MPSDETGLIRVQEVESEEVPAQHVDFFLTIKGASLIVGDAALNKAREVQQLITELKTLGVTDAEIKLLGVQADVSTGILGRNSSATYQIKVHCARLETLPDFLGVITSQKNVTVNYLEWDYGDLRDVQGRLLDRCLERANEKAQRIARGLHITIKGVHRFTDHLTTNERATYLTEQRVRERLVLQNRQWDEDTRSALAETVSLQGAHAYSHRVTTQELAMQISHSAQVTVGVNIEYRIAPQELKKTPLGELAESA